MEEENKQFEFTFGISRIRELEFTFTEPTRAIQDKINTENALTTQFGVTFNWDLEKELFRVIFLYTYYIEQGDKKILLLKLVLATEFLVKDLKNILTKETEEGKHKIPDEFMATLLSIAYANGRGVIYSRTKGSFLNRFVLPLVNPMDLVTELGKAQAPNP